MERSVWLGNLAEFLIESNKHTYAGNKEHEVLSDGSKVVGWSDGPWSIENEYAGSLRAPGRTKVSYKSMAAWIQAYGGVGMNPERFNEADPTFDFLKDAILHATPKLPFRGPERYRYGGLEYRFRVTDGHDLSLASWREEILDPRGWTFAQTGAASIVIRRDKETRAPLYPWDI